MGIIKILDKTVADKIAAGEVVERPASVVKELVENSIDAQAGSIIINLEDGGHKLIEVIDDGLAMKPDDAMLAPMRFATSKINALEDLQTISSFGFRGEALPSIGAISRMEIITRQREAEHGVKVTCAGGELQGPDPIGASPGTRILIRDIFFNTPARRKFLKSSSSETANIVGITQKLALVNDQLAFKLISNGKTLLDFPAPMNLKERVLSIWGLPFDYPLIPIEDQYYNIKIKGFICPPDNQKSHRSYQILFVNSRYIKNTMLNQAVKEGFEPLLPSGKFPIALVYLTLPGDEVDINVHPNKMEVRFAGPGMIFKGVRDTIKKSLRNFGFTPIDPTPSNNIEPFSPTGRSLSPSFGSYQSNSGDSEMPQRHSSHSRQDSYQSKPSYAQRSFAGFDSGSAVLDYESAYNQPQNTDNSQIQQFKSLFQLNKTYIIGIYESELWIIDQHTAHERINYEKLCAMSKMPAASQKLLFPFVLDLPPALYAFLEDKQEYFEKLGFEAEGFGGSSYLIKSVPQGFDKLENKDILMNILEDTAQGEPYSNLSSFLDSLRSVIACRSSVKAGDVLKPEEMDHLVNELIRMDYSSFCPHGRPVVIKLSKEHIDRMFHRL